MVQLITDVQHIEVDMSLKHHMALFLSNVLLIEMVLFTETQIISTILVLYIKLKIFIVMIIEKDIKNKSIEQILNLKIKKISILVM